MRLVQPTLVRRNLITEFNSEYPHLEDHIFNIRLTLPNSIALEIAMPSKNKDIKKKCYQIWKGMQKHHLLLQTLIDSIFTIRSSILTQYFIFIIKDGICTSWQTLNQGIGILEVSIDR